MACGAINACGEGAKQRLCLKREASDLFPVRAATHRAAWSRQPLAAIASTAIMRSLLLLLLLLPSPSQCAGSSTKRRAAQQRGDKDKKLRPQQAEACVRVRSQAPPPPPLAGSAVPLPTRASPRLAPAPRASAPPQATSTSTTAQRVRVHRHQGSLLLCTLTRQKARVGARVKAAKGEAVRAQAWRCRGSERGASFQEHAAAPQRACVKRWREDASTPQGSQGKTGGRQGPAACSAASSRPSGAQEGPRDA